MHCYASYLLYKYVFLGTDSCLSVFERSSFHNVAKFCFIMPRIVYEYPLKRFVCSACNYLIL